jgi:predicted ATPase/transcriptional regulator with XRE-family HTH domain
MGESLAELLRGYRLAAGISQEALAERCGLSARAVSDIETGAAQSPRLVTLMLVAEALGLSQVDRSRLQDAARKRLSNGTTLATPADSALRAVVLEGRDADVTRLSALLVRNDVHLVTLVGPAGVGKTSLALCVAVACAPSVGGGTTVVELAAIKEPSHVPAAVAAAAGDLREREHLLVLDNLEHLTPAARWIESLLAANPQLTVLATSREPLHLAGEHVYNVRPLATHAAMRLFVQRAQAAKPDFVLTEANAGAVASIVEHLEGLPLAIELAAPRLLLLPPSALAARLERRLPLLSGGLDRPERQRTMRAAIAWSYDLLSKDERSLFERLSVLEGGGTLEAAAAVAGSDASERSILARLAPLVEKNVLALEERNGEPRVSMLEMLREFAHDRLALNGEFAAVERAHAEYALRCVARGDRAFFDQEYRNIRAALEWASRCREVEFGFALIAEIWPFWRLDGRNAEGLDWVARFLHLNAASLAGVSPALHAAVLHADATLESALGNFSEALASCEQAIALQRAAGDDAALAASLALFGVVLQFRGDGDGAERAQTESLEIRRRLRDEDGVAACLSYKALLAYCSGDLAGAASLAQESAAICRRFNNQTGLANALLRVGLVAMAEDANQRAGEAFSEAFALQQAARDHGSLHYSLANLAAVAQRLGNDELALARFRETFDLLAAVRDKYALAKAFEDFAVMIASRDDPSRAARLFGAAAMLRHAIGSPVFPVERERYDAEATAIRGNLGDETFLVQWRIGISMTLERALDEAREGTRTFRPG